MRHGVSSGAYASGLTGHRAVCHGHRVPRRDAGFHPEPDLPEPDLDFQRGPDLHQPADALRVALRVPDARLSDAI